jgi:tryptophanyl-tRNA synthetase
MTKRIFSGMQPTNNLHLGNYLGALRNWVDMQAAGEECIFCVVDLHAITVPQDPADLLRATREIAASYIASGIDPKKSIIFPQSAVPGHTQLMWLLATMAQMGKLERMTQYKDKGGKNAERVGLGLFAYPVLMAADILAYRATHVPVGDDQKQHLELVREIASTFNTRYGVDYFPQPEPQILGPATRVMSFKDGTKKMSKSDESDNSRINLTDDAAKIESKIKKAQTDALPVPSAAEELDGRAGAENLINIYAALKRQSREAVMAEFGGQQWSAFKASLAELAVSEMAPITVRMNDLLADTTQIDAVLADGAARAAQISAPIVREVMDIMGFWREGRV